MRANKVLGDFRVLWWCLSLSPLVSPYAFKGILNSLSWFNDSPTFYSRSSINRFRTFSCAGRKVQLYPDLPSRCHQYYRCLGGVTYSYMCPEGETFDMSTQECRPHEEVECSRMPQTSEKCWHQPDGFYPDYEDDCSSYYSCLNGSVDEEGKCEGGAVWDSATGSCGFGKNVACSAPTCLGLKDGLYPLPGSSCAAYYSCSNGFRTDKLCPYATIFDYMKKKCVSAVGSVCYERACENRVNGLHAVPHAPCNTFYECFNGAMVELKECCADHIFDGRTCVLRSNFTCDTEGGGSCKDKPDGTYSTNEDSQCRRFFVCKNRQVIRKFRCDPGLAFDGYECVDKRRFVCVPMPPEPDCTDKLDGYYTVRNTNCAMFFRCRSAKKISEHTCPGNYVFDGRQCLSPLFHACSSSDSHSTRPLSIG